MKRSLAHGHPYWQIVQIFNQMTILSAFLIKCQGCLLPQSSVKVVCFLNQVSWLWLLQLSDKVVRLLNCVKAVRLLNWTSFSTPSIDSQGCLLQLIVNIVLFNWSSRLSSSSIYHQDCFPSRLSRLFASSIECQGYLLPRLSVQSSVKIGDFHQESRLSPYIKCWGCPLQSSVEVVCFNHV